MLDLWHRVQTAPLCVRWPVKWLIFSLVVFLVLYPRPDRFLRHMHNVRQMDALPNPNDPALAEIEERFHVYMAENRQLGAKQKSLLEAVEAFVYREIPYSWDWEVWGVADYVPTLSEILERGREDCDGHAIVAAALLRSQGVDASLVGDARHYWVRTPQGDTMDPLEKAVFAAQPTGVTVRWADLIDLGAISVGVATFPIGRELIILLTMWLLLLPAGVRWPYAILSLFLLLEALVTLRLAGTDFVAPNRGAAWWAMLHLPVTAILLWWTPTALRARAQHGQQAVALAPARFEMPQQRSTHGPKPCPVCSNRRHADAEVA